MYRKIIPYVHCFLQLLPTNRALQIHIHCFTDSPEFGQRLLDHFPNLCIGITGVITFATNHDTPNIVRRMADPSASSSSTSISTSPLRILLETDAPYMVPSNIYASLYDMPNGNDLRGRRLPLSHSAMIPWTASFVAGVVNSKDESGDGNKVDSEWVLKVARHNARMVYGV